MEHQVKCALHRHFTTKDITLNACLMFYDQLIDIFMEEILIMKIKLESETTIEKKKQGIFQQ